MFFPQLLNVSVFGFFLQTCFNIFFISLYSAQKWKNSLIMLPLCYWAKHFPRLNTLQKVKPKIIESFIWIIWMTKVKRSAIRIWFHFQLISSKVGCIFKFQVLIIHFCTLFIIKAENTNHAGRYFDLLLKRNTFIPNYLLQCVSEKPDPPLL